MRTGVLVGLALSDNLAREVKESSISEAEIEGAGDLRLKRDIVNFICLSFILTVFFIDLDSIDIVFLRLTDSLQDRDRVLENFLSSLLLSAFLLLTFLLLASAIVIILIASRDDVFSKKAPV